MWAAIGESAARLCDDVTTRWQAADPLLPAADVPPPGCGAELTVPAAGTPAAVATCEHWQGAAGSLDLTWGAGRRFQLTARVTGPDIAGPFDRLLAMWRDHLHAVPAAAEEDTAAVVMWPSRDIDGIRVLLRHGFAPRGLVAARVRSATDHGPTAAGAVPSGIVVRRAGIGDIETVVRLGLEVIRFDAHFGGVVERTSSADALRREVHDPLSGPEPWTWLAERDGEPVALLHAERPEAAGWIAPLVGQAPVGYLTLMGVLPGERARGLGTAMVAEYHRAAAAAGVAVSLLHYEQTNPLSAPFWGQRGYRPLWTSWEARPARTMR